MSLRKRISLFFLLAAALIIVTLYAASHLFILNSYIELEDAKEKEDMKRVLLAVEATESSLASRLSDYAASQTIHDVLAGKKTDLNAFFSDSVFLNNRFTSVLLLDEQGRVIFQKKMNFETGVSHLSAPNLLSFMQTDPEFARAETFSGIYHVGGDAMAVAVRTVGTAEGRKGTMLLERAFGPQAIRSLRAETRLPITFNSTVDTVIPEQAAESSDIWIKRNGDETHTVYAAIRDVHGQPAAIIGFEAPRDIYLQGRQTIFLWLLFTIGVAAVLIATVMYVINRLVFLRLADFSSNIAKIRGQVNFGLRLPVKAHDEISRLEREFNRLLDTIEKSRTHIVKLAYEDTLTRLPNRAYFYKEANQQMKRHEEKGFSAAVLFMDLDGFKQVNDRYGHETGDALLRHVAKLLRDCLPHPNDIVSRLGGDEFIVFLTNVQEADQAAAVAQRMCQAISKPVPINGQTAHVSASIGISFYPESGTDLDTLISNADAAMFDAKHLGKNQYAFYREPSLIT